MHNQTISTNKLNSLHQNLTMEFTVLEVLKQDSDHTAYRICDSSQTNEYFASIRPMLPKSRFNDFCYLCDLLKPIDFVPTLLQEPLNEGNFLSIYEMQGPSLLELFQKHQKQFSLFTVFYIGVEMISRLEILHNQGIMHGSLNPGKIVVDAHQDNLHQLYITGFQSAEIVEIDPSTSKRKRIELRKFKRHHPFDSLSAHLGYALGPRDDRESLGYVLLYFFKHGEMYSAGQDAIYGETVENMLGFKGHTDPSSYCLGLPEELEAYFQYIKGLKLYDSPDYSYLKRLFLKVCESSQETKLQWLEWDLLKEHEVNAKLRDFFAKYEAFKNSRMNRANTENTEGPQITEASARGKETGGLELNTTSTDLNLPTATSEQPLRQPFHLDFRSDSDSNNIINPVAASSSNKLFINISELKVSGWQPSTFKQMAQKSDRNTNSSRTDFVLGSTWRTRTEEKDEEYEEGAKGQIAEESKGEIIEKAPRIPIFSSNREVVVEDLSPLETEEKSPKNEKLFESSTKMGKDNGEEHSVKMQEDWAKFDHFITHSKGMEDYFRSDFL